MENYSAALNPVHTPSLISHFSHSGLRPDTITFSKSLQSSRVSQLGFVAGLSEFKSSLYPSLGFVWHAVR